MRALLIALLVAAGLWAGYWVAGSRFMAREVNAFFDAPHEGLTTRRSAVSVSGFPNRFDLTVTDPVLADPEQGWGWSAPFAQVFMMTWKPWHLIAALPQSQRIDTPLGGFDLTSSQFEGSLVLVPGQTLALDRAVVAATTPALHGPDPGWELSASAATWAVRMTPDEASAYEVGLDATTVNPPAAFRMALASQPEALGPRLPEQLDRLHVDAIARLTAPIDRFAPETRLALRDITVKEAMLRWGDLVISGAGRIAPGPGGQAEGRIDLRVENWRALVPVLVAAGIATPEVAPTVTRAMELLAQQGPDATVLNLPLILQSGRMSLGPLPLGPAPLLQRQ